MCLSFIYYAKIFENFRICLFDALIHSLVSTVECRYNMVQYNNPDSKVHGANMGPIWGRQDPGGPHVGPMNFATWEDIAYITVVTGAEYESEIESTKDTPYLTSKLWFVFCENFEENWPCYNGTALWSDRCITISFAHQLLDGIAKEFQLSFSWLMIFELWSLWHDSTIVAVQMKI